MRVTITVADDYDIGHVASRLQEAGLCIDHTLHTLHVITGSISERQRGAISGVEGVLDVSDEVGFQLPPPDAPVQ